jgi:hypothetical protein
MAGGKNLVLSSQAQRSQEPAALRHQKSCSFCKGVERQGDLRERATDSRMQRRTAQAVRKGPWRAHAPRLGTPILYNRILTHVFVLADLEL